jgi:hypothetical protein
LCKEARVTMTIVLEEEDVDAGRRISCRPRREAQIDLLVAGLVQGASVEDAAEAANLARSTAYELLAQEDVQERLRKARADALAAASRTAAALAQEAVGVLANLMRGARNEGVRRMAADSLLTHAAAMARDAEVEARIAALDAEIDRITR